MDFIPFLALSVIISKSRFLRFKERFEVKATTNFQCK